MIYDIKKYNSDKLPEEEFTCYAYGDTTLLFDMEFDDLGNSMHVKIVFTNNKISLYIMDKFNEAYVLNASYDISDSKILFDSITLSPTISKAIQGNFNEEQTAMYSFLLSYGLAFVAAIFDESAKKKEIKSSGYTKTRISKYELEYRTYEVNSNYDVIKKDAGFTVILPEKGNIYTLPSKAYHLPNEAALLYSSSNTADIEDIEDIEELNAIMKDVVLAPGNAIEAADIILNKLIESGYADKHICEYKYGWMFWSKGKAPYWHAFVLIDGKHILDSHLPAFRINEKYIKKCAMGEINSMPADTAISLEIENICTSRDNFTNKYGSGRVSEDCFYIASSGTKEQAKRANR